VIKLKTFSKEELRLIKKLYSNTKKELILEKTHKINPNRTWNQIIDKARYLKIKRNKKFQREAIKKHWNKNIEFQEITKMNFKKGVKSQKHKEWVRQMNKDKTIVTKRSKEISKSMKKSKKNIRHLKELNELTKLDRVKNLNEYCKNQEWCKWRSDIQNTPEEIERKRIAGKKQMTPEHFEKMMTRAGKCSIDGSEPEKFLRKYLKEKLGNGMNVLVNYHQKILGDQRHIDITIPEFKLAIEVCGYWHHTSKNAAKHVARDNLKQVDILNKGWIFWPIDIPHRKLDKKMEEFLIKKGNKIIEWVCNQQTINNHPTSLLL